MSNKEFQMPRKFTFDEFYELLKTLVADPEAQKQFAIYDAECKAGRGDILYEENGVAAEALYKFRSVGILMLYELGWPNYGEALKLGSEISSLYHGQLQSFPDKALAIMQGKSPWPEHDLLLDIEDRQSIREYLTLMMSIPYIAPHVIYSLEERS